MIHAQYANQSLSNLIAPTAINVSLQPNMDNLVDLGSGTNAWKDSYIKGNFFLNGSKFVSHKGVQSTFIGIGTGYLNSGSGNTGVGYNTMYSNTTGNFNTGVGSSALYHNTTGLMNTMIGWEAGYGNTTGSHNTGFGDYSCQGGTDSYNTACGFVSLVTFAGSQNTITGVYCPYEGSGTANTAAGYFALHTEGNQNTADGTYSGEYASLAPSSNNSLLGILSEIGTGTLNNASAFGFQANVTASNHLVMGSSSVTSIGGYTGWSNISDGRVKENIRENVPGLAFINMLRPITYNLNPDAADKIIQCPRVKDSKQIIPESSQDELMARKEKEQVVYSGFIAQEVEQAARELNYDFSGVDAPQNDHSLYGLRYSDFVVPLVKAEQELSRENDEMDIRISELQKRLDQLKTVVIESLVNTSLSNKFSDECSTQVPLLGQNIPNPFSQETTIPFSLSGKFSSAQIIVSDLSGQILKAFKLQGSGTNQISIHTGELAAGTYQYSLQIDGIIIDTKQMILTR